MTASVRVKVTVVIATYCSGPQLDDAVASLDAQTLPAEEFEVLLLDDGSPDGTYERLVEICRTRPHFRAVRLPHTGWPSGPRNHGIETARGEYVLFMDHDDTIGAELLDRASSYGREHAADAVNVKETRTRLAGWGLPVFDRSWPNALHREDHNPLGPMTPHKLYRRELLLGAGIRFPDGRRAIWEDIFFNVDVLAAAERIAILSDVDGYHWRDTDVNSSKTFERDAWEQWTALKAIFTHTRSALDHRPWLADSVHANFLASQVIPLWLTGPSRFGDDWDRARADIAATVEQTVSAAAVSRLDGHRRALLRLLLDGADDLAAELAGLDDSTVALSRTSRLPRWDDGVLHVETVAAWQHPEHAAPRLRSRGDRVERDVGELSGRFPAELLDITPDVESAESVLALRDRETLSVWALPTEQERSVDDSPTAPGASRLEIRAAAVVDIRSARMGHPLHDGVWDLGAHNAFLWGHNHRRVQTSSGWTASAIVDGRPVTAFATPQGTLAVDVGDTTGRFGTDASLERSTAARGHGSAVFAIRGLHVFGGDLPVSVRAARPDWARRRPGSIVWRATPRCVDREAASSRRPAAPRRSPSGVCAAGVAARSSCRGPTAASSSTSAAQAVPGRVGAVPALGSHTPVHHEALPDAVRQTSSPERDR